MFVFWAKLWPNNFVSRSTDLYQIKRKEFGNVLTSTNTDFISTFYCVGVVIIHDTYSGVVAFVCFDVSRVYFNSNDSNNNFNLLKTSFLFFGFL